MTLPNFLVIGAGGSGTTAIYEYLRQHPQIYLTPQKETNFFGYEGQTLTFCGPGDHELVNESSITHLDAYQAQFDGITGEIAIGEVCPLYIFSASAPDCIRHYVPDVKLIAMLRHPADRAYTNYLHMLRDCSGVRTHLLKSHLIGV
ncbi:MAG: hypothetical protein ETSY1_37760 [Candidatus Entotheonella factor]|uniref:Sulfotransferase domain-containing protein n=1 Tax=Entotheonella factor TaxID=1429438 RepID=W4L7B9_ENTF1|nr:MAG: hypothetical protein ETSY1_37760 [Candidatus Entotheonella factor]